MMPTAMITQHMSRAVVAVAPDTSIEAAARLFLRFHIGGAPVVDNGDKPIGFVTTKDLLDPDRKRSDRRGSAEAFRLVGGGREPLDGGAVNTPGVVADVMTNFVVSVPVSMSFGEATRLMVADDLHRVLVVNEDRAIVGILSSFDVMRVLAPTA